MHKIIDTLVYLAAVAVFVLLLIFVFPPEVAETLLTTEWGYVVLILIMIGIGTVIVIIEKLISKRQS